MAKLRRKRRTREHIIADLSVHHIEGHVLRCGWLVERMAHDYGIDLELHTFDRSGQVQPGEILLQLKATDRLRVALGRRPFPFASTEGTWFCGLPRWFLLYWLCMMPGGMSPTGCTSRATSAV